MIENSHDRIIPKKQSDLPIINKLTLVYKNWQDFLVHFPKTSRYFLGKKIDFYLLEVIELIYQAITIKKAEKLPYLIKANSKLDLSKFFLQIAWQIKAIDNKKYTLLSTDLDEIGRMLGGWIRQIKETSA